VERFERFERVQPKIVAGAEGCEGERERRNIEGAVKRRDEPFSLRAASAPPFAGAGDGVDGGGGGGSAETGRAAAARRSGARRECAARRGSMVLRAARRGSMVLRLLEH
jgi:hypothetical protein